MAALFCEVFVPYYRDGALFTTPRDTFSVGKFISSFSSFDFRLFDFDFFFSVVLLFISIQSRTSFWFYLGVLGVLSRCL